MDMDNKEQSMDKLEHTCGQYDTPQQQISLFSRLLPSITTYSRLVNILYKTSKRARNNYKQEQFASDTLAILRATEQANVKFSIKNLDNVQSYKGPCVFIANHMSSLESFVLPCMIAPYKKMTFIVKQSLMNYPILGTIMQGINAIPVSQTNPREDLKNMMQHGLARLNAGISIVIFPQGERTPNFERKSFNSIGVKLAKKANVPIIPIALRTDAWGIGRVLMDIGSIDPSKKVSFCFGKPIFIQGRGQKEHEQTLNFIEGWLKKWGLSHATMTVANVSATRFRLSIMHSYIFNISDEI